MKFTINTESLAKALGLLVRAIPVKTALPILSNFLFDLKGELLRVTASDGDLTMRAVLKTDSTEGDGSGVIPAKLLIDLLKTLPSCPVTIELQGDATFLFSWETGNSKMPAFDVKDYPEIKAPGKGSSMISISQQSLADGIGKTVGAVSEDSNTPAICGILFDITPEGVTLVGTDSHRLMIYDFPDIRGGSDSSFILGKKAALALKGALGKEGECQICFNGTHARLVMGNYEIIGNLVAGKFPRYRSVIPTKNNNVLQVDRQALVSAIRRIGVCADKASTVVRFSLTFGRIDISAQDLGMCVSATERMDCDYDGDDIAIGFKAPLLADVLSSYGTESIELRLLDERHAVLVVPTDADRKDEHLQSILMPIMVAQKA